jgi:hypothetical protein
MKHPLFALLIACCLSGVAQAQGFTGHASGTLGMLNPKLRVQYEAPLMERGSFGINVTYYTMTWEGPMYEPFLRIYNRRHGNEKGLFGQVKAIYGNLSVIDPSSEYLLTTQKRWSTYGMGLNIGYKFLLGNHFTIEPLAGLRLLSSPHHLYDTSTEEGELDAGADTVLWYIMTGFPLDFQLKFGFQF